MGTRVLASLILTCALVATGHAQAATPDDPAQTALHILDYIGVDYAGAADNGKIISASEYEEQRGFVAQVTEILGNLPPNLHRAELVTEMQVLGKLIADKAAASEVASHASKLKADLTAAYNVRVVPRQAPDLAAAPQLYRENCAGCHGVDGRGDGSLAASLDPHPANFHNAKRMPQRSLYGLYSTITLGVNGTPMVAFTKLTEDDRWALAFYVADFSADPAQRDAGAALWKDKARNQPYAELDNVVTLAPDEMRARFGDDAAAVQTYLRAHPEVFAANKPAPIDFSIATIADSVTAYRNGDRATAQQLAAQAYLDGFDLVEKNLQSIDAGLMTDTEHEMTVLRELMRRAAPITEVEQQVARVQALLQQSKDALAGAATSSTATFFSSLLILLREGIEAILVVAAIIAFLVKTDRRDALPYVHAGWIGAIALGVITWAAATWLIDISGTNREVTEGATALIASAMLVYVGYWLHSKASARAWQHFIKEQIGAALAKSTLWAMAFISFFAVYREMFETVLFYQALWAQAGGAARGAVIGGIVAAVVLLGALAWGIFKYSLRLPLKPFFTVTSALLCVLAVVLAGKGIAALQNAGKIPSDLVHFPSVPLLGIFPTLEGLATQIAVCAVIFAAFRFSTRAEHKTA